MSKPSEPSKPLRILQVTCGLIHLADQPQCLLAARRSSNMPEAGFWEFPGGKLEPNESPENCLMRELEEELGINVSVNQALTPVSQNQPTRILQLLPFICTLQQGSPEAREHDQLLWAGPAELLTLNWIPADLVILKEWLQLL